MTEISSIATESKQESVNGVSILLKERVRRFSVEVKRTELNCVT